MLALAGDYMMEMLHKTIGNCYFENSLAKSVTVKSYKSEQANCKNKCNP